MFCFKCGKRLEEDMIFCPYCGARVGGGETIKSDASAVQTQGAAVAENGVQTQVAAVNEGGGSNQLNQGQWQTSTGEQSGAKKKKKPVVLIAVIAVVVLFLIAGFGATVFLNEIITSASTPALSIEEYKAACEEISYSDLARNPETYKGRKVVFTGEVVQVFQSGNDGAYRVNVTKGIYGLWTDTIYMETKINTNNRILEDDIITIYGESMGIYTYTTVLGNELSIPAVKGVYVYLNE